jgi:hypothetical protein
MVTISLDLPHHLLVQVFPAGPTAILRALQVLSAITAHHVQVLVAVHVNVTVSLAEGTVSNSIVGVHAVVTATILVLVVLPAPIERKNTYLEALEDMVWWSGDDKFLFGNGKAMHIGRSFVTAISSLLTKAASSWS